ncbi:MAG TPA: ribonuclease H-like domain-containing protein [Bryobacteraceae bacterium]|nr:ribonuclease H-like domain-containing protein [Bryobacteraceae bacterium]
MDIREQLAYLRRTIGEAAARADEKYGTSPFRPEITRADFPQEDIPAGRGFVEDLLTGEVVENTHGKHFQTEKLYARHRRHGSFDISDLIGLAPDYLCALSESAISACPPTRWAFLDTETTGLAGGSGTYAFLIGLGSIDEQGFRVRQFFMRDYDEEASLLHSLAEHLQRFDVLVTYNGKSYDQPLLETRYTMNRARHPFARLEHLDLLHGARRLFKLRLENCRLVNLENQILGVEREGDLPGELIPYCYFEYLRTRRAFRLVSIFHHNLVDIISLACLTGVIPEAFRDPENARARHGTDLLGLARWLRLSGRLEEALRLVRRAIEMGLPDRHLFASLFEAGMIEKKLGLDDAAVVTFTDLSLSPNPFRARAYEELAKHYEHREKNYLMALECVRAARRMEDTDALLSRQARLERRNLKARRQPRLVR